MGSIKRPQQVKLFASIIYLNEESLAAAISKMTGTIGPIEQQTQPVLFTHTRYYEKEMGQDLMRLFVLFGPLADRETLPGIKIATNAIEDGLAREGRRTVNIDSGYIALEHVILATTKGYSHRVYLGDGIHADLTLMFHDGSYRPLQWTYPDYAEEQTISIFNRWRDICRQSLKP
ncbi:MAG TPA: DUF4416 family protein [Syntrophorhabdaceae bacterium]|nr:DUF4416 family protein [Syntrophorhabdaceae bacterium]